MYPYPLEQLTTASSLLLMNGNARRPMSTKTLLIGDPGSTHCGDVEIAHELVRVGKECGLDMVKFQLFPNDIRYTKCGNIPLDYSEFTDLVEYGNDLGICVFASVFNATAYKTVAKRCKAVKFSYKSCMSTWIPQAVQDFKPDYVFVSGDVMNQPPEFVQRLYCIPEYPVRYKIDFDGIFSRFDGFSDHTLGVTQSIEAIRCGAKVIEKHYRLDRGECDKVPDGAFALKPRLLEKLAIGCGG